MSYLNDDEELARRNLSLSRVCPSCFGAGRAENSHTSTGAGMTYRQFESIIAWACGVSAVSLLALCFAAIVVIHS